MGSHIIVLTLAEYRSLVMLLPIPSRPQMERFAEFVATAHSWYKHLRGGWHYVQFFLDPVAGMQLLTDANGRIDFVPRVERGFHHSWVPTQEYRHQFGYLSFSQLQSPRFGASMPGGKAAISTDMIPRIFDPTSNCVRGLPVEILAAGQAPINWNVHRDASQRAGFVAAMKRVIDIGRE